ncbi:MAG: GerAB/ArcD/ProY family transporter [Bacilli bacterium]
MIEKITSSQLGSIIYLMILSNCIGTTTNTVLTIARQDSWLSIILALIIGFIPLIIILSIMNYKPELNIIEKNQILFGKILGNIINAIVVITVFLLAIIALWDLTNFISSQYLYYTPPFLIGICFIITIIYLLYKDIIIIARTCFILFIIGFFLYFLGFFGLIWQIDLNRIKPFLEISFTNIGYGAILTIIYNIIPLYIITIIPKSKINYRRLNLSCLLWYFFSLMILFIIVFLIESIFGPNLAILYQYSPFHLIKNISLFGFINRVEKTFSLRWIFYLVIFITMCLYFILEYFQTTFKKYPKKILKSLILILPLLTLFFSEIIFQNNLDKEDFTMNYLPIISISTLGLVPFITWIIIKLNKK